ncbi:short-chain dehydrogenase/reductase SDR [Schizopora paradoxa]|uniref:Short-chain dehydrogenase/reductase SDR n=1 Tax=Schizopora paradoxa TaxID=27342 RepID=A0A0H2RFA7_9AGAM|nr:short-chain dehydrogenase/reductase SDR [Schizopora paradoxa]
MANTLSGKKVLVVGGTSGMGFSTAKFSLLDHAAEVIVASSTKERVDSAVARLEALISEHKLKGKVSGFVVDAMKPEAVKELMAKVGELDHLVWTATGEIRFNTFKDVNLQEQRDMFDARFWGLATAAQVAKFRPGASITHTTGTILHRPQPGWGLLCGGAGAVDALTRGLAIDLAPVRVNCICPGAVRTELWRMLPQEMLDLRMEELTKKLPVKHVADGDEVADAYLFCMKCRYVTGQTIVVDGGGVLV